MAWMCVYIDYLITPYNFKINLKDHIEFEPGVADRQSIKEKSDHLWSKITELVLNGEKTLILIRLMKDYCVQRLYTFL